MYPSEIAAAATTRRSSAHKHALTDLNKTKSIFGKISLPVVITARLKPMIYYRITEDGTALQASGAALFLPEQQPQQ